MGGAVRASRADQYCIAPLVVVPPLQVGATLSMAQILALLLHIKSGTNEMSLKKPKIISMIHNV